MKIGIIGPYPPPYGGRSIHVQRLVDFISANKRTWKILIFDNTKKNQTRLSENVIIFPFKIRYFMKFLFAVDVVHYHGSNWLLRVLVGFLRFFGRTVIVSLHSNVSLRNVYQVGNYLRKILIIFSLRKANYIIATHSGIKEFLRTIGIYENILLIPSFVAPTKKKQHYDAVPQYVWNFIKSHKPTIAGNAYQLVIRDGIDVYGLDLLVELIGRLKKEYPTIGLIFLLPEIGNFTYFKKIQKIIHNKELDDNILIVNVAMQAYPIWENVHVFVRPTTTDTTAISLYEALWFGTPAIASDCVSRPEGVLVFKNRDVNSLVRKTSFLLEHYEKQKRKTMEATPQNYADDIVKVYENVMKGKMTSTSGR